MLYSTYTPYITITDFHHDFYALLHVHPILHKHRLVSQFQCFVLSTLYTSQSQICISFTVLRPTYTPCITIAYLYHKFTITIFRATDTPYIIVTDLTLLLAGPEVKFVLEIHNHNVSCYQHSIHHSYRLNPTSRRTGSQNLRWPRDRGRHLAEHQDRSAGWEKCPR